MIDEPDEYPHWRTALFGNGHVANLYCGCKYVLWHTLHVLLVVIGVLLVAGAVPLFLAYRAVRYVGLPVARWLDDRARTAESPYETRTRVATRVETIREAPVTRRIYGYCPVHLKINPRWYESLGQRAEAVVEWAEPPTTIYVCDECGFETHIEPTPDFHRHCDGSFQKVVEGSDEHEELAEKAPEVSS